MREHVRKLKGEMTWRRWLTAAVAGIVILGAASGAQAGEGHWRHWHHGYYYGPSYYYGPAYYGRAYYAPYYAGHYYYAPSPVVTYGPPVVYEPAYPAYSNFSITVPLR